LHFQQDEYGTICDFLNFTFGGLLDGESCSAKAWIATFLFTASSNVRSNATIGLSSEQGSGK
jgi:hypothetical protein